jgi:hypothetical protein
MPQVNDWLFPAADTSDPSVSGSAGWQRLPHEFDDL